MTMQRDLKVLREEIVAPAALFAAEIRKGQVLRIVDIEGQQVADLVVINAASLAEKLSVISAEMEVVAAFSNCPQVHSACNGFRLKPLKAVIYEYSPY